MAFGGLGLLGLSGGGAGAGAGWAISPDVAIDLDFLNNRAINGATSGTAAALVTTTRASTGWAESTLGTYTSFANNTPRITDKGLLVEEGRTNSVRNNSMQGAVASAARAAGGAITTISRAASTTVTVVTASAHNLSVNDAVTISGCAVGAYNGTFMVATAADATHFTYVVGSSATDSGGGTPAYSGASPGTLPTNWNSNANTANISVRVAATGTLQGIDYVDLRFAGVATAASFNFSPEPVGVAATNSQVWMASLFHLLAAGSLTNFTGNQFQLFFQTNVGNVGNVIFTPAAAFARAQFGGLTQAASVTACGIIVVANVTSGTVIDVTIRVGWPQLELCPGVSLAANAIMTSPIRTTGAAAARALDVVTIPGLTAGAAQTLFFQGYSFDVMGRAANVLVSIDDATTLNRGQIFRNTATGFAVGFFTVANVNGTQITVATAVTSNVRHKLALAMASADQALILDGGTPGTQTNPWPAAYTQLTIAGFQASGAFVWNGWTERVAMWNLRKSNAYLQSLTT